MLVSGHLRLSEKMCSNDLIMITTMMLLMKMMLMAICADWPWEQMSSSGVCHFRSRDLILARKCPNEEFCVYFDDGEGDEVHGGNLKRSPYMQSQASLAVRFLRHDIEKGQWYNILYLKSIKDPWGIKLELVRFCHEDWNWRQLDNWVWSQKSQSQNGNKTVPRKWWFT